MKHNVLIARSLLAGACLVLPCFLFAVSTVNKQTFRVSAVVSGNSAAVLTIQALPLGTNVFAGKHFVVPVQVTNNSGSLATTNLQIEVAYQLFDTAGNPVGDPAQAVPVQFPQIDPDNPSKITGVAYIDRNALTAVQAGGQIKYFFLVLQGAAGVYLGGGTSGTAAYPVALGAQALSAAMVNAFVVNVVSSYDTPVSPAGSASFVPDTYETDGLTGLVLGPHSVTNAGTLRIENLNLATLPSGPGGSRPVSAYNFSLIGTSLQQSAQLVLTYPADLNGQISGGGDPTQLAPYGWDGVNWRVLGRPQIDTTLHTVTVNLPPPAAGSAGKAVVAPAQSISSQLGLGEQFEGSFALFPAGAATTASLRPTQRIITPNGDGINDVAVFEGLVDGDVLHIFDVRGRRVRTINASNNAQTQWDGRDDNGSIVDSGVYIYQYTTQGSRVSGVIVVAK